MFMEFAGLLRIKHQWKSLSKLQKLYLKNWMDRYELAELLILDKLLGIKRLLKRLDSCELNISGKVFKNCGNYT